MDPIRLRHGREVHRGHRPRVWVRNAPDLGLRQEAAVHRIIRPAEPVLPVHYNEPILDRVAGYGDAAAFGLARAGAALGRAAPWIAPVTASAGVARYFLNSWWNGSGNSQQQANTASSQASSNWCKSLPLLSHANKQWETQIRGRIGERGTIRST